MNKNDDMSGRVNVVLPDEIYELIKDLAEAERRSQSQMAAILIEEALKARNLIQAQIPSTSKEKGNKDGK